jgi:hypothetical protein
MSVASFDATGVLVVDGVRTFPITLSNPPPPDRPAASGRDGFAEVASAGVTMVRSGRADWSLQAIDEQLAGQRAVLDAASAHGLQVWLWLGDTANFAPATNGQPSSANQQTFEKIVGAVQTHPALGAYKGIDEPRNPFRGENWVRPDGLVTAYRRLKELDAAHPMVVVQAPLGAVSDLVPYQPAFDVTGADVFPVSYPPGVHAGTDNHDISVVGDITKKMRQAAGTKPVWMTLQIAWNGVAPSQQHPDAVPRFPTLHEERFMAYQAIVNGARGLAFFGGHMTQITSPDDAAAGWNWRFWDEVLRPLVSELTSTDLAPALTGADTSLSISASAADVEVLGRETAGYLYLLVVRRGTEATRVDFHGLPAQSADASPLTAGEVLFEYVQEPPPPPIVAGKQIPRTVAVTNGAFADWLGQHDARVYRFTTTARNSQPETPIQTSDQ